ncbi:MAG: NYN domain-containing protein, partial [Candidatus Brocadiaceae bacterium]|nr:NYN domain-containing protein [Candidatus Brocadiaceae bacterium]
EGRLAFRGCNQNGKPIYEQKRIDTLLALDLALLSGKRQITHAVLLTGDSDFVPVIKVVQSEGVLVWLFHGSTPQRDLWESADERFCITQDFIARVHM